MINDQDSEVNDKISENPSIEFQFSMNMKVVNKTNPDRTKTTSISYPKAKDLAKSAKEKGKNKSTAQVPDTAVKRKEVPDVQASDLDLDIDDLERELDDVEKSRNALSGRNRASTMKHHNNSSTIDEQFVESCAIIGAINVER